MPITPIVITPTGGDLYAEGFTFGLPDNAWDRAERWSQGQEPTLTAEDIVRDFFMSAFGDSAGSRLYNETIERLEAYPVAELGHGSSGWVFELSDGLAMKITAHWTELGTAAQIAGMRHPGLPLFYDAFAVIDDTSGFGIILREPITHDMIQASLLYPQLAPLASRINWSVDNLTEWIQKIDVDYEDEFVNQVRDDLVAGANRLLSMKIDMVDIHAHNVGLQGDRGVIFDLGGPMKFQPAEADALSGYVESWGARLDCLT
jgi:hypothetical protein